MDVIIGQIIAAVIIVAAVRVGAGSDDDGPVFARTARRPVTTPVESQMSRRSVRRLTPQSTEGGVVRCSTTNCRPRRVQVSWSS